MQESTKISLKTTLIATLIGTAVGIWTLQLGVGRALWPGHPQLMAFVLTLIACVVAKAASASWLKRS
jgi:hypothetical protein